MRWDGGRCGRCLGRGVGGAPAEAAQARALLRGGADAVAADGVLVHVVDDGGVEPVVEVVVGRQLAPGRVCVSGGRM